MELLQLIVLSLIQGITEFLPVSSAAHLILVSHVVAWPDQGVALDVAAHLGSLLALLCYFHRRWTPQFRHIRAAPLAVDLPPLCRLLPYLLVGSIPTLIIGYVCRDFIVDDLREVHVIAWASILFGICLGWADYRGRSVRLLSQLCWFDVCLIGLAQALALIPGTSRAGIVITAALCLGFQRTDAARYAFLMALPVISSVSLYEGVRLWQEGSDVGFMPFLIVLSLSWLSAWLVIGFFLRLLPRIGLLPFVIYRIVLGMVLLAWF